MQALESFIHFALNWYWVPLLILYIGLIGAILIENRNPTKTIAWILVIIFIPFIGLILYYFFGQKFVKVQKIKRSIGSKPYGCNISGKGSNRPWNPLFVISMPRLVISPGSSA